MKTIQHWLRMHVEITTYSNKTFAGKISWKLKSPKFAFHWAALLICVIMSAFAFTLALFLVFTLRFCAKKASRFFPLQPPGN